MPIMIIMVLSLEIRRQRAEKQLLQQFIKENSMACKKFHMD